MKKVYTLSVIDEDGEITGKPGTVLAASREITLDEETTLAKDMIQGHGALVEKVYDLPKDWDHTPYKILGYGVFQKCVCTSEPVNSVKKEEAIWIWEKIS
jgi:hypothetical protein